MQKMQEIEESKDGQEALEERERLHGDIVGELNPQEHEGMFIEVSTGLAAPYKYWREKLTKQEKIT